MCLHNNCCHENTTYRRTRHCQECTKHRMQCHGNRTVSYLLPHHTLLPTYCNTHLHVHYPSFLSTFNQIWLSWPDFHRSAQYQISEKIHPVEAMLIITCGQTYEGHDKVNRHFPQLCQHHLNRQNKSVNNAHTERKHSALQYDAVPDGGST